MWNAGAMNVRLREGPESTLAQVINYPVRPSGHPVSLAVVTGRRTAVMLTLNGTKQKLETASRGEFTETYLPPFPVYAAVEFGG